ncbi:MAG: outer membrane lipoprotein carrier protein LolA [Bryocella sp.]
MRHKILITVLLTALPLSAAVAQGPTASTIAKAVDNHYNHLASLQARYTERYQGMGLDRSETGTLTLKKPGRMRWAYDSPVGKVFVLDGHDAISYTPGDPQATRIPAKQLDDLRSPLRFLLGHTELRKELDDLTLLPANNHPGLFDLSGVPKGMQQRVHRLTLTVDPAGTIHGMRIEETDGAVTTFTFTNLRDNIPTSDADFHFAAPPGVTVVNGTSPI